MSDKEGDSGGEYYDSDPSESISSKSDKSDESLKKLQKKLKAVKNNEKVSSDDEKKSIKEKVFTSPNPENEPEDVEENYDLDSSVKSELRDAKQESYSEEFEVQSNSFSIRSKQSIKSIVNDDEDNKIYTIKKESENEGNTFKTEKGNASKVQTTKQPDQKALSQKIESKHAQPTPIVQTKKVSETPTKQEIKKQSARPATALPTAAAPQRPKSGATGAPSRPQSGLTQHQIDMKKKQKANEEADKKLLKAAKLPEIGTKALKLNSFTISGKISKNPSISKESQRKQAVKEELNDDLFGEEQNEKGDQAVLVQNEKSEEAKKAEEKERKQAILKEQLAKRKDAVDNQEQKVKDILKQHKRKQEEMQEREDQLYVRETVEKMQQKKINQNLGYENEKDSKWVDILHKDYKNGASNQDQQKDQDKVRDILITKVKKEEIEMKKNKYSGVDAAMKVQENNWDNKVAPKKGTINEISKIESEKKDISRENAKVLEMKQRERKKYLEHLEIEKALKNKAKEFVKEGEDNLKKGNRALDNIDAVLNGEHAKKKKEKERNIQHEEAQKERGETNEIELRRLRVQLRQLTQENQQIIRTRDSQREQIKANQDLIAKTKNKEGVVVLGNNKFTSFGLVPALQKNTSKVSSSQSTDDDTLNGTHSSAAIVDKINESEMRYMTQETVIELIIKKITEQGFTLSDIFQLLDRNKDGLLSIQEIEQTMGKLDLNLNEEEIQEMVKIVDGNKDGLISEFEFVKNLESQYQSEKEYKKMMGDLQGISNPIILEERTLDLEIREKLVLKNMKIEEEKSKQKGPDYEKFFARLKKQEDSFNQRQKLRKQGKDLKELTTKASQIKLLLKQKEDERAKFEIMHRERMEAIALNIGNLTDELVEKSEIVIKAKVIVEKLRNDYQKLVLKQVAIDRLQEQVQSQKKQKELEQQKHARKFQNNMNQKALNVQYEQQKNQSVQNVVGAAILLQKIYRGWKARAEAKKRKQLLNRAILFIGQFYWWYSRKRKARRVKNTLLGIIQRRQSYIISLLRVLYCHYKIKLAPASSMMVLRKSIDFEKYNFYVSKQAETKLKMAKLQKSNPNAQQQSAREGEGEGIFGEEESEKGLNSSSASEVKGTFGGVKYDISTKRKNPKNIDQFQVNELPAVMTLQRGYRRWQKNVKFGRMGSDEGVIFSMGGISPICRFCNEKKVEVLCRSCEQCIFCVDCYERFHRSYHRKNHRFYELKPQNYKQFEHVSEKKITEYKEEIYQAIASQFQELKKKFSSIDQNTNLVPLQVVYEQLEKIQSLASSQNLLEKSKQLVTRFLVSDDAARQGFRKIHIEQKYDKSKQYVDHIKFIRFFINLAIE